MIYSNIAEYEAGDSMLARQTILDLHKEIERLIKNYIALEEEIDDLRKLETTITMENERLHSIIKELKHYIKDTKQDGYKLVWIDKDNNYFESGIEEILDKADKEKQCTNY